MTNPQLPAALRLGAVHLTVSDLARSQAFYTDRIGLRAHAADGDVVRLGAGGDDLLVLTGRPGAPIAPRAAGLYHFAIRVPTRADLGGVLAHLAATHTGITGASDHLVSEALYLDDPDGIGIEIYRDRPRAEWPIADGALRMASDPLDVDGVLAARGGAPWAGLPAGTDIGHVHLHVSRLDEAERFYAGVLGFDVMQRLGGTALFVAAGGYHHHLGLNTWAGVGAPPPPEGAVGLRHFEVVLPDADALGELVSRVRVAGTPVADIAGGAGVTDPSGHRLRFTS